MRDDPKLATPNAPVAPTPWRDIRLDDCRKPEDRSPDQIATLPAGRGWLRLALLVTAVIVLVAGLHVVAPAPGTTGSATAGIPR